MDFSVIRISLVHVYVLKHGVNCDSVTFFVRVNETDGFWLKGGEWQDQARKHRHSSRHRGSGAFSCSDPSPRKGN